MKNNQVLNLRSKQFSTALTKYTGPVSLIHPDSSICSARDKLLNKGFPHVDNQAQIFQAAKEIHDLIFTHFQTEAGPHVGTMVSAAARMAGSSLMRSFGLQLDNVPPGSVVLSEQANEGFPKLIGLLKHASAANGITIHDHKVAIKPPQEHAPIKTIMEIQAEFADPYRQIMANHHLDDIQGAYAGTIACSMIIINAQQFVDPHILFGIAAYGFIEGTKTAPLPLSETRGKVTVKNGSPDSIEIKKKPWWHFGK